MSLAEQLAAKRGALRHAQVERDASAPKTTGYVDAEEAKQYQVKCLDINIEEWVGLISEHTFGTTFLELSPDDGHKFIEAYRQYEKAQIRADAHPDAPHHGAVYSDEVVAWRDALAERLQEVVEGQRASPEHAVFVKLSSRSAKDAAISHQHIRDTYHTLLGKHGEHGEHSEDVKMKCMLQAGLEAMKVFSARGALDMFLKSERVYQDMLLAHDHVDRWHENVVVREWVDIEVDMEFRGFVHNHSLTALSQYNHMCFFPRLANGDAPTRVPQEIQRFFEAHIKSRLAPRFSSYVIDFAIVEAPRALDAPEHEGIDWDACRIQVIELNPFLETTDGALFSWGFERALLEHGPFEYRFVKQPRSGAKALLSVKWRELLDDK